MRFGVPFSEYDTVFLGVGFERTEIGDAIGIPLSYLNYRVLYGDKSNAFPLTLGWSRDARDSLIAPSAGRYQRVNLEWSLVGDVRYPRTNLQYQEYWPLAVPDDAGRERRDRLGRGLGGKPYPVFKNFYGGGLGSVRTFEQGSLGVVDPTGAYIGGARRFNLNTELYFPVPGTGNDKHAARLRLCRRRQRLARGREGDLRFAARFGRHRPVLDLAGGPAEDELGQALARAAQR